MTRYFVPICWALLMLAFALLARFGWADREAVVTLLLVMPMLAVVTMQRGNCRATLSRKA